MSGRVLAVRLGALLAACALLAAGCDGEQPTVAQAVFDDVVDLTTNNAVKIADVPVGRIAVIELSDDNRALVTMEIDPGLELPANMSARLRKTSVLGERYVELVPDLARGGRFESGSMITDTAVVPELEETIVNATDLLVAISADTLAGAIEGGATGLDGRSQTLSTLLDDLTEIVSTYDDNSADLVRLVGGLETFLAEVGPQSDLHGRALNELARFTEVLREEDDRLIDTLGEVQDLAVAGTDIMTTHRAAIDAFFVRFAGVTEELTQSETELERLFFELSKHNFNTIRGVNSEHAQVVLDFIVCGVNDTPGDPVRACDNPPQGRPRPEPRPPQDF